MCIAKLSTFQLIARARRPHNIKFTFVHIEKFNLTFAQALIGAQFSVGWWRYIRLNWLHLCNISPNFKWKFNRAEYIWEMIIPATLDAHCRGSLPWLRCEIQENRTSLCSILKLNHSRVSVYVFTPSLKMADIFCRNINHVAMDLLKTSKMEMSQTYITI